jgi:hypothetical protein
VPAKTFVVTETGVHDHADDAPGDVASVFSPLQAAAAVRVLSTDRNLSLKGLSNYLVAAGFPEHTLPPSAQRSRWLLNHKHRADAESRRRSGAAASSQHAPGEEQRPRAELLQRSLHQWPEQELDAHAALFLVNDPPCQMTANRMCIPFASRGMCNVLRWIADPQVVVFVDTKQSCMAHGWSVITASIAVRGKLWYTTLGRSEGRRVQAGAYTSHAAPVLQAIINVENTDNILQFFDTLKRL